MKKPKHARARDLASKSPDAHGGRKPVTSRTKTPVRQKTRENVPQAKLPMLDPYLTTMHPFVRTIADNVVGYYEAFCRPQKRKAKAQDEATLATNVLTIFANLARAAVETREDGATPAVGVSLRAAKQKRTRYTPEGVSGLPRLVETLSAHTAGFTLRKSGQMGVASAMVSDAAFNENLRRYRIGPEHFEERADASRETILLTKVTDRDYARGIVSREFIDYADTPDTRRLRAAMARINDALRTADMSFEARDGGRPVLTGLRHLRRRFDSPNGRRRFDRNGRLFGGWWQTIKSEGRHAIRLDGEPVADLDFSAMFLRLAYIEAGHAPPEDDDLYALAGFERHRDGVKEVVNAMLARDTPMTRLPRGVKELLPRGTALRPLRAAILTAHPKIAGVLENGFGPRLMFRESEILVAALLRLIDRGVTAVLPMHDGLMCPESKKAIVRTAMGAAAEAMTGFQLLVKEKEIAGRKSRSPCVGSSRGALRRSSGGSGGSLPSPVYLKLGL